MEAIFYSTSFAVATAASMLLSAIWEGAVLAVCAFIFLRMFPDLSAAARSVVWMNVFVLLVLLHFVPFVGVHGRGATASLAAPLELDLKWGATMAGIWAILSLLRASQLIFSAVRLHGLAQRAKSIPIDEALRGLLRVQSSGTKANRSAELCVSGEVERPSVLGFLHPRILLPPGLKERLTRAELEQVVRHEMEHLRRGDDWTNLLQKIALVIFPLNPVLLWVEHRLCLERELACDDSVLRSSCGRKAYAICLTRLAEHRMLRRGLSLALGAWERQPELVRRVHRILRRPTEAMGRRQTLALTGSVVVGVMMCAVGLAHSPQLIGFAEPHAQPMAQLPPAAEFSVTALAQAQIPANIQPAHVEMIKAEISGAVMPGRPLAASTNRVADQAKAVARNAVLRSRRRRNAEQQQAWVVMAGWYADGFPQLVLAVEQTNRSSQPSGMSGTAQVKRVSYAAVPIPDGWLLVEI